ncbi:hypothetical protein, partial [Serratia marcescens]|nr:hypothetical protein [Serratia marcescens]
QVLYASGETLVFVRLYQQEQVLVALQRDGSGQAHTTLAGRCLAPANSHGASATAGRCMAARWRAAIITPFRWAWGAI